MHSQSKVSVIIPVYNVEKFLFKCLNSVCNQTLKDIEIICINDGSTDTSPKILKDFAQREKRFVLIEQKNLGAGAARNVGLRLAKGKYLSFLDADDFFDIKMLELAYCAAEDNSADIIIFLSDLYDNENKQFVSAPWILKECNLPVNNPFNFHDINGKIFNLGNAWAWNKLYRRKFIEQHNLYFQEIRTSNDMFFVLAAYIQAKKIYFLNKILAHQRINLKNSLSVTREKSWDCFYLALRQLQHFLQKQQIMPEVEQSFCNWALDFSLWQLKTLKGIAHIKTFQLLHDRAFDEFGISNHSSDYYYDNHNFKDYKKIMNMSVMEYSWEYAEKFFGDKCPPKCNLNQNLEEKCKKLSNELNLICVSRSFRIGRFITFIPRKIRGGIRCYRENGFHYTWNRLHAKIKNKFGG